MRQWQCPCGAWVDMTYGFHTHLHKTRAPTFEEMLARRKAGDDNIALEHMTEHQREPYRPEYPRRDKPNE